MRGIHRQCGDIRTLAMRWYGGDAGCDTETHVVELTQLLHYSINLLPVVGVEDRFSVIEDYENLFGRSKGD